MPQLELSPEQLAVWSAFSTTSDNLLISACAGGAKTTTMVELAKRRGNLGDRIVALAFNKDAQLSLESKMPYWVQSQTFHSFCLDTLARHLGSRPKVDGRRCAKFLKELVPAWKERVNIEDDVLQLVSLAKSAGYACLTTDFDHDEDYSLLESIADYYGLQGQPFVSYANQILEKCATDTSTVDFDDMLWLTLKLGCKFLPVAVYLLDEAQDTNVVQRELLKRMLAYKMSDALAINSKPPPRLIAVGDPHQSIYGFRGAESNAMSELQREFNMTELELSVSYRCSQRIVEEARKYL